jgi:hypothetical protein
MNTRIPDQTGPCSSRDRKTLNKRRSSQDAGELISVLSLVAVARLSRLSVSLSTHLRVSVVVVVVVITRWCSCLVSSDPNAPYHHMLSAVSLRSYAVSTCSGLHSTAPVYGQFRQNKGNNEYLSLGYAQPSSYGTVDLRFGTSGMPSFRFVSYSRTLTLSPLTLSPLILSLSHP